MHVNKKESLAFNLSVGVKRSGFYHLRLQIKKKKGKNRVSREGERRRRVGEDGERI